MTANRFHAIAMIYAEALFDLAGRQQLSETTRLELDGLREILDRPDGADFALFLESPAISHRRKAATVCRIFEGRVSPLTMNFLKVLASRDRLGLLREIQSCFTDLQDEQAGRVNGSVTTAVELTEHEKLQLNEQVNRIINKTVSLRFITEPAIIAGLVLNIEDTVMDASVGNQLKQLSDKLQRQAPAKLPRADKLIEM